MSQQQFDPVRGVASDEGQFSLQHGIGMSHRTVGWNRANACGESARAIATTKAKTVRKGLFTALTSMADLGLKPVR